MRVPPLPRGVERVNQILLKRGFDRFALFLLQQEGRQLPRGVEALSGFVLTSSGEVYGFWLDWDDRGRRFVLDPWYRVDDPSELADDPEYQMARRQLGL